ncbi:MAG TPA: M20 family metallo-hydrolase [Candidatus Sulfotelmatobacter sp.]|nr:M20 family metallo-hydrolase [Candidatus Sulfotelmatobacter sp.]
MARNAARAADGIDEARLWQRLMAMARFGARADGGVDRQALSAEDVAARRQLIAWAEARGFACAVDPIGNLFVRRAGREPDLAPVLTGSHLDSQPTGGKFDGVYGVLAGFEVLEALEDLGLSTRRSVEAVAWTNEEGSRFQPGAMGSAAFAGRMDLAALRAGADRAGVRLGDALDATLAATPTAARRALGFPVAAYVENHIEQGPLLEADGKVIGAVTGIQGSRWFAVEVTGEAAHAGTTPLKIRKDALKAATAMVSALESLMADPSDVVRFTVGRFEVAPNSPNTVPDRVFFTIDFRHPDAAVLQRLGDQVEVTCRAAARGCAVRVTQTFDAPPVDFAPAIVGLVSAAAARLGLPHRDIFSGAFHDAKFLAEVAPTGMLFVPCARGISHNPAESATASDLAAGARVLAEVVAELAAQ